MAKGSEGEEVAEKSRQHDPLVDSEESELDNDPVVRGARDSTETANHDREILDEEDERETLLASENKGKVSKGFTGTNGSNGILPKKVRKDRMTRRRRYTGRASQDGEGKLIFEMEEGGPVSDVSSEASRSSVDIDGLNEQQRPISRVSLKIALAR